MKISFLIPTKDGGEGFLELIKSIKLNIEYCYQQKYDFEYDVTILINGNPKKPLSYIESNKSIQNFVNVKKFDFSGKVRAINSYIKDNSSDILVVLDDDISFSKELLFLALKDINSNQNLRLVSFQNQVLPYIGHNPLRRFFYDVINVRSLKKLYLGTDPFLFGRFIVIKKEALTIPDQIINEDLYLSLIHEGHYIIRPEKIFYKGEFSVWSHTKRVLRIESGRRQTRKIFGHLYEEVTAKNKREIDLAKLKGLNTYYKICYHCYYLLRFFTNSIATKFLTHETSYW